MRPPEAIDEIVLHGIMMRLTDMACWRWCTLRGWEMMLRYRRLEVTSAARTITINVGQD